MNPRHVVAAVLLAAAYIIGIVGADRVSAVHYHHHGEK